MKEAIIDTSAAERKEAAAKEFDRMLQQAREKREEKRKPPAWMVKEEEARRQPVETGPPGTGAPEGFTLILAGANTTQKAFGADKIAGLHRGELEGVIATLANLPASFAGVEEREGAA